MCRRVLTRKSAIRYCVTESRFPLHLTAHFVSSVVPLSFRFSPDTFCYKTTTCLPSDGIGRLKAPLNVTDFPFDIASRGESLFGFGGRVLSAGERWCGCTKEAHQCGTYMMYNSYMSDDVLVSCRPPVLTNNHWDDHWSSHWTTKPTLNGSQLKPMLHELCGRRWNATVHPNTGLAQFNLKLMMLLRNLLSARTMVG